MAGKDDILTKSAIDDALAELPDWRYRLGSLVTVYKCPTSAAALELIAAVGRIAEQQNHHPDLDWRYNRVFDPLHLPRRRERGDPTRRPGGHERQPRQPRKPGQWRDPKLCREPVCPRHANRTATPGYRSRRSV